jgi:hypothetical protein
MNQYMIPPKPIQMSLKRAVYSVPSPKPEAAAEPSHGDIAERAYDIYVTKGRRQGECVRNWLQAEQDLRTQARVAFESQNYCDDSRGAKSATSG